MAISWTDTSLPNAQRNSQNNVKVTSLMKEKMCQEPESCPVCKLGPPWSEGLAGQRTSNWSYRGVCPSKSGYLENSGILSGCLGFPLPSKRKKRLQSLNCYGWSPQITSIVYLHVHIKLGHQYIYCLIQFWYRTPVMIIRSWHNVIMYYKH